MRELKVYQTGLGHHLFTRIRAPGCHPRAVTDHVARSLEFEHELRGAPPVWVT